MEPISRREAATQGLTHFFTGRKCKNGHLTPRFVSTGGCVECGRAHSRRVRREVTRAALKAKEAEGQLFYPVHPDDRAAALACLQLLDIQRGRRPYQPESLDALSRPAPQRPEDIEGIRRKAAERMGANKKTSAPPPDVDLLNLYPDLPSVTVYPEGYQK